MPYHTGGMKKAPMKKAPMKKAPKKKSNGISSSEMKKLETHSKMHKGGMSSKHMKNMIKFMRQGDAFIVAHNKAKKMK
jgi:hypothetical protein